MVPFRNIRSILLLTVLAAITLASVGCETEQVQYYLTPTQVPPGHDRSVPDSTPIVAATELPPTREVATPPSTPVPTVTPTAQPADEIPEGYMTDRIEAEEAALVLGCTGWSTVKINDTTYYRPCADDDFWAALNDSDDQESGSRTELTPTVDSLPLTPTATMTTHSPVAPTPIPTQQPIPTPPPYHYATESEALAGAAELGCSGWSGTVVDGISYYRACGSNREFEQLSSGAAVKLSGEICTIESDPTARFTHPPTDLEHISTINPPGSPIGGVIKPHSYIFNKDAPGRRSSRVPVYAVADSVLTAISYYGTPSGEGEYLLFFDVTCEISFKFDHISELAPKIAAIAPVTPSQSSATTRTEKIEFEAGEIIAYTVGAGGQGPWDFGAYDLTYTNQFANQERYEKGRMSQSIHTVCPYEYFDEPLSSHMLALLGTHNQKIVPGTPCYTSERDVLGAASGAWFDSLDLNFSDSVFSAALLAGDYVAITGIGSDIRIAKGEPTWLDPAELTSSHCYASNNEWRYIEIIGDGMTMKAAGGQGSCPAEPPADATTYYR